MGSRNEKKAIIKRIAGLNIGLENCRGSVTSRLWSNDLKQYYVFTRMSVLRLLLPWENLSASGWVTSLQKHKYKQIFCCVWKLSSYQATTVTLVFQKSRAYGDFLWIWISWGSSGEFLCLADNESQMSGCWLCAEPEIS